MPPRHAKFGDKCVFGPTERGSAFRTTFSHHATMTAERRSFFWGAYQEHRFVHWNYNLYITQAACSR